MPCQESQVMVIPAVTHDNLEAERKLCLFRSYKDTGKLEPACGRACRNTQQSTFSVIVTSIESACIHTCTVYLYTTFMVTLSHATVQKHLSLQVFSAKSIVHALSVSLNLHVYYRVVLATEVLCTVTQRRLTKL